MKGTHYKPSVASSLPATAKKSERPKKKPAPILDTFRDLHLETFAQRNYFLQFVESERETEQGCIYITRLTGSTAF